MDMTGERLIAAPRAVVWEALNDPEILRQSIPGCDKIEKTSDNGFTATVTAKVGPVKASFSGAVTLSDIDPPNGYTIRGEGKGGPAGFASGGAQVKLEEAEGGTKLSYVVDAKVGGKLAQIGSRLIDATARKMADDFFARFSELVVAQASAGSAASPAADAASADPAPPAAPSVPAAEDRPKGLSTWVWVGGVIVIVALLLLAFGRS
jgi:carbon monoxide dehydrogenase subunit G